LPVSGRSGCSTGGGFEAQDFTGGAFGGDLERPAADFAIRREPLPGEARINDHFKSLAAEWTLDVGEFFHAGNLTRLGQSATSASAFSDLPLLLKSGIMSIRIYGPL
jgi:hypothetical protein